MKITDLKLSAYTGTGYTYKLGTLNQTTLEAILLRQKNLPTDLEKGSDWKVYPYMSTDGRYHGADSTTYTGTGIVLMDIDSQEVYSYIREHTEELFGLMPNVVAVWPSFSRKLHLAVYAPNLAGLSAEDFEKELKRMYLLNMSRIIEVFEQMTGQSLYTKKEGKDYVCDAHNARVHQAICLNPIDEFFVNENVVDMTTGLLDNESRYRVQYCDLWNNYRKVNSSKSKKEGLQYNKSVGRTPGDENTIELNIQTDGKYLINRDFCLNGFRGNEARWRIAKAVLEACNYNMSDAVANIRAHIENADELISVLGSVREYKVPDDVHVWVRKNIVKVYVPDETIMLDEGEYVAAYKEVIMGHLHAGQNVYIKAGCGVGKSFFYREVFSAEQKVCVITHMCSTRDGVYANNIGEQYVLKTSQARKIIKADGDLPEKLILVWNTLALLLRYPKYRDQLTGYIKLVDESHNLVTSLDYRHEVIYALTQHVFTRTLFCSATPAGEHCLLGDNCHKFEFTKNNGRTTTYTYMYMSDKDGRPVEAKDRRNYDYTMTITKLVEEKIGEYDAVCIFDNRGHAILADEMGDHAMDFSKPNCESPLVEAVLQNNNLSRKVFVTTSYGTEGIEIKRRVELDWDLKENELAIKRVLAIFPIWNLRTTEVEQTMNRFRGVERVDVVFITSDDPREVVWWGVGQGTSLRHMSQYAVDDDIKAEIKGYSNRYYADTSTYYSRENLKSNTGVVMMLSNLQYRHKHYSTISTESILIHFPEVKLLPGHY